MENYLEGKLLIDEARKLEKKVKKLRDKGKKEEALRTAVRAMALYAKGYYTIALDENGKSRYLYALMSKSYLELLADKGVWGEGIGKFYREVEKLVKEAKGDYIPYLSFAESARDKKAGEIMNKYLEKISWKDGESIRKWSLRAKLVALRFWERYKSDLLLLDYWLTLDTKIGLVRKLKLVYADRAKELEKLEKVMEEVQI